MKLLDRLKLLVQSTVNDTLAGATDALSDVVHDLVGEDSTATRRETRATRVTRVNTADTDKLIRQADQRVEKLRDDLAGTVAREKRTEQAWREAGTKANQLNAEVDALLRENQTDAARAKLQQAQRAAQEVADLERELQRFAQMSVQLRDEIEALETQLSQIRQRMQRAGEREANADLTDQRQQDRQAQRKDQDQMAQAEQTIRTREERVAQREDQHDARQEVDQTSGPAGEAGMDSSRMADVLKKLQEQRNAKPGDSKS